MAIPAKRLPAKRAGVVRPPAAGGVLTQGDLHAAWKSGRIKFTPDITEDQIGISSIDLRVGSKVTHLIANDGIVVKPARGFDPTNNTKSWTASGATPIRLKPRDFLLVFTHESITVPHDLAAAVQGKSSLARAGLAVHITAPHIHPAFSGPITLEMYNHGPWELELCPEEDLVCQIIYYQVSSPVPRVVAEALGSYIDQATPFPAKKKRPVKKSPA